MYESLKGKKLLVLGSAEVDANIVTAAHALGVHVTVVDGNPKSPSTFAKNVADASWDMDYSQTDALADRCRAEGIDGILAGYSEFRVSAAAAAAKRLGTPFYATEEQIELTRNKRRFKDACQAYGIRTPRDFPVKRTGDGFDLSEVRLPVIVKPTDAAGRKGITICTEVEAVQPAIERALRYSVSNSVIVEEYVKGMEFAAIYTVQDGQISLSCFNEKYLNREAADSGLCDLALAPSTRLKPYLDHTDAPVRAFLRGIGVQNGVAFFQGIVPKDGEPVVFETGLRLNGGNDYLFAERENGISYMKMLIAHSLTGIMEGDLHRDDPAYRDYCATFLLYAHAGRIGKIAFTGDREKEGLMDIHIKKAPGQMIVEDGTTRQSVFGFKLIADSLEKLTELIIYCQDNALVTDENGQDLMFKPFDPKVLYES